jgi:hypothetical protein
MHLGAFDIRDMAFLGGGRLAGIYRLAQQERLAPRYVQAKHRTPLWSFAQLVAYRTWRYFSAMSGARRFPVSLVSDLEALAESVSVAEVGVTASGTLFRREGEVWFDSRTGQEPIQEVLAMDRVFRPFPLGGGHVPDLVEPSTFTMTDPAVGGGTPALRESRISGRALAAIDRKQGRLAVFHAYPDVDEGQLEDGIAVGLELLTRE